MKELILHNLAIFSEYSCQASLFANLYDRIPSRFPQATREEAYKAFVGTGKASQEERWCSWERAEIRKRECFETFIMECEPLFDEAAERYREENKSSTTLAAAAKKVEAELSMHCSEARWACRKQPPADLTSENDDYDEAVACLWNADIFVAGRRALKEGSSVSLDITRFPLTLMQDGPKKRIRNGILVAMQVKGTRKRWNR